ncbi:uncharacterized protein LOC121787249 [Salvia splendens]|nr:uncharacterized protein LOC121787249 [Salvia splendens]
MKGFKKLNLLLLLLPINMVILVCASQAIPNKSYCGSIKIQQPLINQNSSSLVSQLFLCKSKKLYFRTSIGLFKIQSINYTNKLIIISHTSSSPTSHFVSPSRLSAGFPPPPASNSLILLNCSNRSSDVTLTPCDNVTLAIYRKQEAQEVSSCSVIDDTDQKLDPKQMGCTRYSRVYAAAGGGGEFELGTTISFDIPDHVPDPCNECEKPYGNCGVGLRCACHPKKCRDKVISAAALRPYGVYLVFFIVFLRLLEFWTDFFYTVCN